MLKIRLQYTTCYAMGGLTSTCCACRPYLDYVNGFGNAGGNFWIGLESIYQLTAAGAVQLRITLETWEDTEDLVISYSRYVGVE